MSYINVDMKGKCRSFLCASAVGTLRNIISRDKSEMNEGT